MSEIEQRSLHVEEDSIEILVADQVLDQFLDKEFNYKWDCLYDLCSWATVYQKRDFVATWYSVYHKDYLPIIIKGISKGELTGLLTLAICKDGRIIGAGANQAEYQVWLANNSSCYTFINNALNKLRLKFPRSIIHLKYIPATTPLDCLINDPIWKKKCSIKAYYQPLMIIKEANMPFELRKKNRREKLNRLKRIGDLKFVRVTDDSEFDFVIDELALQYDFRKGATVNIIPFINDPLKKKFLLLLFKNKLLHVTLLKLNNEIIASNVGTIDKSCVHLQGINTHSPLYAKYSPGILHFLMLGQQLEQENISVFDLTPGGDSYKEGLANSYAEAYTLTISNTYNRYRENFKNIVASYLKSGLEKRGINKAELKKFKKYIWTLFKKLDLLKKHKLKPITYDSINYIWSSKKIKLYMIEIKKFINIDQENLLTISRDNLADLLSFESDSFRLTRWEFLEEAMHRFEAGDHCYTWSESGLLLACVWQGDPKGKEVSEHLPDGAAVLQGIYYHHTAQARLGDFLAAVIRAVAGEKEDLPVYMHMKESDVTTLRALDGSNLEKRLT